MEIWKDIPGYEGYYQVSDLGRVRSKKNGILKGYVHSKYKIVNLKGSKKKVHQLVAICFLNHIPCGMKIVVDHINKDTLDNRLCNLQLISNRENCTKDRTNKLGLTGVRKTKSGKYSSHYRDGKKYIHLGTFDTPEEAYQMYLNAIYH
jgi:hypothetical protein